MDDEEGAVRKGGPSKGIGTKEPGRGEGELML